MRLYELLGIVAISGCTTVMESNGAPAGYVPVEYNGYTIFVAPDYVRGDDGNYMNFSGQRAADYAASRGAVVPTREIAELVTNRASHILRMPTQDNRSGGDPRLHYQGVRSQLDNLDVEDGQILAGHMKDVVRTSRDGRTAIWGGSWDSGSFRRIQPYSTVHGADYSDYSQGLRLVHAQAMDADGNMVDINDIVGNPRTTPRPMRQTPTVTPPAAGSSSTPRIEPVSAPRPTMTDPRTASTTDNSELSLANVVNLGQTNDTQRATPQIDRSRLSNVGTTNFNLRSGARGNDVAQLQTQLQNLGYDVGNTGADGIFGRNTAAAVRQFQTDNNLTVDGIVGDQTMSALRQINTQPTTESRLV